MSGRDGLTRRQLLASAPVVALAGYLPDLARAEQRDAASCPRVTRSVCRWCYASISLRDFCQGVAKMVLSAIDLLTPDEWPVAKEGDVIRTIRDHQRWIALYHTGGVPGRNEIDDSQELHYPAIVRAIAETGFTGFIAHEFVPKRDPLTSLREDVVLCAI